MSKVLFLASLMTIALSVHGIESNHYNQNKLLFTPIAHSSTPTTTYNSRLSALNASPIQFIKVERSKDTTPPMMLVSQTPSQTPPSTTPFSAPVQPTTTPFSAPVQPTTTAQSVTTSSSRIILLAQGWGSTPNPTPTPQISVWYANQASFSSSYGSAPNPTPTPQTSVWYTNYDLEVYTSPPAPGWTNPPTSSAVWTNPPTQSAAWTSSGLSQSQIGTLTTPHPQPTSNFINLISAPEHGFL